VAPPAPVKRRRVADVTRLVRYACFGAIGLVVLVFALQMTLPYERAKDKLIEALSPRYDVTVGSVERGIMPGRVYFNAVSIRSRDAVPSMFYIDRLEGDVGLFALLGGNLSLDLDAKIGSGDVAGNVTLRGFGDKGVAIHLRGKELPASSLPMRGLVGLPMSGKLELALALDLPNSWQQADGDVEISCPAGCTYGDGKTKLKPVLKNASQQVMVQDGIEFGKIDLASLDAKVDIKNGALDLTKFDVQSSDGELHVDYHMKLERSLDDSSVTGCVRFKGADALLKKEPKTYAAIQATGAERRPDGLFHIKLSGRFKEMRRDGLGGCDLGKEG
jgi:type II secretion system protein N